MNLLQNLLITDNVWAFSKVVFGLEAFSYSIKMDSSLAKKLISPQKMFVSSANCSILISWCPVRTLLIPCHYH